MGKLVKPTLLLICTLMLMPVFDDAEAGGRRHLRQDRLEIGRGMLEVQNVDWTTLLRYYADDIEYHDSIVDVYGIDMLTQFLGRLYGSSPDLVTTIEDETLVGGVYSATWTMVGSFNGVPYEAKGISIIKFRRWSREVYYWRDYYTEGDIMENIPGFDEAILGFRTYYRCAVDPTFDCPLEPPAADALPEIKPMARLDRRGQVRRLDPLADQATPGAPEDRARARRDQRVELAIAAAVLFRRLRVPRSDRRHLRLRHAGALLRPALRQFAGPGHHGRGRNADRRRVHGDVDDGRSIQRRALQRQGHVDPQVP